MDTATDTAMDTDMDMHTGPDLAAPPCSAPEDPVQSEVVEIPDDQEIDFVTLGMFIIDEIEFLPPRPPVYDILGGAGSYSALGARLFSPPPSSKTVGWIVDQGSDFPPSITEQLASWQTSALLRSDPSRLTTRGWNGYTAAAPDHRAFRYTTPKQRLTAADLTPPLLRTKAIHLICSPLRCQSLVADLLRRRKAAYRDHYGAEDDYTRPVIVWEPVPDLCVPDELLNCTNTLPLVDVCSPNAEELAGFMGDTSSAVGAVERACEQLLASMPLQSYTLVVRAGARGCYIARNGGRKKKVANANTTSATVDTTTGPSNKPPPPLPPPKKKRDYVRGGLRPDTDMEALFAGLAQDADGCVAREEIELDPGVEKWVPAYYTTNGDSSAGGAPGDSSKVVDPTGGGNTFLGGLAVALARGRPIEEACAWGHVAASFAIEQVGFPVLSVDAEGGERWNGWRVEERLGEMRGRLGL
ncbi:hypothetical protein C8A05DRAFT_15210 [Staphylotrichum tortipilum]|uniref:Carbohydrate kinase PfkB domain-containing protein n=1 Tax=Staphylotrichum tortipilum TaxID=2831512 RepID=A0AAN6MKU9_9PEZI|nr:hypothetical protein C8A05DRAFT_15210 [Staphylotrichum longicolle]